MAFEDEMSDGDILSEEIDDDRIRQLKSRDQAEYKVCGRNDNKGMIQTNHSLQNDTWKDKTLQAFRRSRHVQSVGAKRKNTSRE